MKKPHKKMSRNTSCGYIFRCQYTAHLKVKEVHFRPRKSYQLSCAKPVCRPFISL